MTNDQVKRELIISLCMQRILTTSSRKSLVATGCRHFKRVLCLLLYVFAHFDFVFVVCLRGSCEKNPDRHLTETCRVYKERSGCPPTKGLFI